MLNKLNANENVEKTFVTIRLKSNRIMSRLIGFFLSFPSFSMFLQAYRSFNKLPREKLGERSEDFNFFLKSSRSVLIQNYLKFFVRTIPKP